MYSLCVHKQTTRPPCKAFALLGPLQLTTNPTCWSTRTLQLATAPPPPRARSARPLHALSMYSPGMQCLYGPCVVHALPLATMPGHCTALVLLGHMDMDKDVQSFETNAEGYPGSCSSAQGHVHVKDSSGQSIGHDCQMSKHALPVNLIPFHILVTSLASLMAYVDCIFLWILSLTFCTFGWKQILGMDGEERLCGTASGTDLCIGIASGTCTDTRR